MYKNKKDVDKHVEKLLSKLSGKEFKTRAYSVARLYFDAGDYASCQKYVEQYLTQKDNNAAAYKLLGLALQKMGQKDKALEQFKTSLDIDQTQTGTIIEICELLADDEITIDLGRAKYWLEKAEATFPRHPVTFRLREKLISMSDPDPDALVKLLTMELNVRPKDPVLHARLLRHYLKMNQFKEAFEHGCNVEFSSNNFINNYAWYENLNELLKSDLENINKWLYQLLLLTVRERLCVLSLTETSSGSSKSIVETSELLHAYDQALGKVASAGAAPGFAEFHASLLQHHRGQFYLHVATFLLKKAKKDLLSWSKATSSAAPLMLLAWQTVPLDTKVNWLRNAPEKQVSAANRWYSEGTYRCSQSGHYLITNFQDKSQSLLDQISQCCSGSHWKDKLYEGVFTSKTHLGKNKTSHFTSSEMSTPQLRLPRKIEVEAYDSDAQKEYGNSLHHFVWTLLNYKNYAHFKCTLFDMLAPTVTSCAPETLNKLDIYAFLYCAAMTTRQQKSKQLTDIYGEKPSILPANITDLLCPLAQMKWWDCAYKFSQNLLGSELTDIRATLSRGIEVVRCIDNHGLDPELLCNLGRIFADRAKVTTSVDEKISIETRAGLYYGSAIPLLEKLKNKMMIKVSDKRMFDYTHNDIGSKELNALLEESKLFVAVSYINDSEYEKAIEMLVSVKSDQAYYHLAQTYKKVAFEERNSSTDSSQLKYASMLSKAKNYAYKALDLLKNSESNKNIPLYSDTQELIEEIEMCVNKIEPELSQSINDIDGKYSSDENISYRTNTKRTPSNIFRNISSTPKANQNHTNYRTAIDSQILETTRLDQKQFERIENEIKNLQKRDNTITDFIEQTKNWFEENRNLGNKIISTINPNIEHTTNQLKLLKISVDQMKDQVDECRNECKDVGELKKEIDELKKEVNKLKKSSSEKTSNEGDLYNVEDEYRTNETSNYGTQLPFTPQMVPSFNQRPPFPAPPNPYQLYNQTLFNLYNQYSQFNQPASVPGAPPLFDPSRGQINYPGVYPTPDQMFLDMAHLIPPATAAPPMPTPHSLPAKPPVPPVPIVSAPSLPASVFTSKATSSSEIKDVSKNLPVNVVITSSDPLPTSVITTAPVLSVTIPQKHIKANQPHNYQIAMPAATESNISSPPSFSFSMPENKNNPVSSLSNWNKAFQTVSGDTTYKLHGNNTSFEVSNTVVDGPFAGASPNTSLNKSRTLSEKSNTSVENYDPCPDFKPIIPLPAEVKVTTGEEDETPIFSSRAKLFRFVDKQWKERGLGDMKLLKNNVTGKVRVLMRREQVHKICANHIINPKMEINPMKNETKAYIWVANDFAEETVVLEKFCIRFKTADVAKQFYETFEKARQESEASSALSEPKLTTDKSESKNTHSNKSVTQNPPQPTATAQEKTVVGGFTFSSAPLFRPVERDTKIEAKNIESESNKTNVFSNLTFKTNTASPFSNLFNTSPAPIVNTSNVDQELNKQKLNTSDTVDEFEPTAEFKPVIALPALVEQKTGEEDELALFEHRAKLLRYDATTKEWKERGLGNIKLLAQKDNNQKVRLLMRREQIMKVCCNHGLTKEMTFQKMPNMDKAVTWCAKDYSEGELIKETFCLRFKNVQACDDFMNAVETAQSKMKDDTKATKEEQNASKQMTQSGFGDQFKAKAGSWYCQGCYTNNLESYAKCACCEQPNPQSAAQTEIKTEPLTTANWGDKFKPKPGSWECQSCFVRNEAKNENCSACNSPKDPSKNKSASTGIVSGNKMNFSFGIPQQTVSTLQHEPKIDASRKSVTPAGTGFGDQFRPKEGTWECKQCFVRNEGSLENCCACNSPQDPNAPKKSSNLLQTTVATPSVKFRFGIPPTLTNEETPKTESIFGDTGANKFSFGIPSKTTGDQKPTSIITDAPKAPSKTDGPLNFSVKNEEDNKTTPVKEVSDSFAGKESGSFGFVFKTTASKSPAKSPHKQGDQSDNEDLVKEEDCNAYFNPVIPLPDKVEVVTGEENEEELYGHRARLYIMVSAEWKERGTGLVKILKNKDTKKLRIVMRREQVLKICLNHALTSDVMYKQKDEKTWIFAANDFSEGELSLHRFCLRFSNKEIALQFMDAVENALKGKPINNEELKTTKTHEKVDDDVVFVSETQANTEEKQKAKDLMLPENFYTYQNKEPCQGCRGCSDGSDEEAKSDAKKAEPLRAPAVKPNAGFTAFGIKSTQTKTIPVISATTTPMKSNVSFFQTPTNSVYGTPGNDKTFDTSMFRTPLGSIGSNTGTSTPTDNSSDATGNDATDKENLFSNKSSTYSNFGDQRSIFGTPKATPSPLFGGGDSQTPVSTKSSLLAPPKLSTLNTSNENKTSEVKSIFSSAQVKPAFGESSIFGSGLSTNKSLFGFAADKSKDEANSDVKSIFGGNETTVNLFSGVSQGSIFGPGSLNTQPKSGTNTFGSGGSSLFSFTQTPKNIFSSEGSSNPLQQSSIWAPNAVTDTKPAVSNIFANKKETKSEEKELPLKLENELSFASLKTTGSGFEKKADFKWEGTGQQLFNTSQKKDSKNESGAGDDTGGADDEFDPHYEPIVPLPDKIHVTTGEEDEEKMFGDRGKLYRYDDKAKEWKERGVGEVKILYHLKNGTYRMLLRREQVYKTVLNMLIHPDLDILPMKNSDRAWTWAGMNFDESNNSHQELLALRFKSSELANSFRDLVQQCVRKLQAAAATAIREEKEAKEQLDLKVPAPLRLPKNMQENTRADMSLAQAALNAQATLTLKSNGDSKEGTPTESRQVHFQEHHVDQEEDDDEDDDEEDYEEHDYDQSDYYNEEEAYYSCEGEAVVKQGDAGATCPHANIQVLFDQEIYSPKILVTDANTGEILADMLIHTDTEFLMAGDSCTWTGTDFTSNKPVDKTVTINFFDTESAVLFYDSCETSKAATYSSNDPES